GGLAGGDVGDDAFVVGDGAVGGAAHDGVVVHPADGAVGALDAVFVVVFVVAGGGVGLQSGGDALAVVGVGDVGEGELAAGGWVWVVGALAGAGGDEVRRRVAGVGAPEDADGGRAVDDAFGVRAAGQGGAQSLLGLAAQADVATDAEAGAASVAV